jgi:phage baseplate assembly protein W
MSNPSTLSGFAFPFQISESTGGVKTLSEDDKLRANIVHILLTNVGERVMRRSYGGGVRRLVQDPSDNALRAVVQHQIGKTIGLLEPRVQLQQLTLSQSDDGATLFISVRYLIVRKQAVQSLSVPIALDGL